MSPEFRSLLAKEWAERRSLFWTGLAVMTGFLGYCVAYELEYRTRALIASHFSMCSMIGLLAVVLLAMSTATGEYSRRTLKFSASLPVPLSRVAWARLLGAWGCLVVPIVCGAIVLTVLFGAGLFEQARLRTDDIDRVSFLDGLSISRLEAIGFVWTTTAIVVTVVLFLSTLVSLIGTCCRSEGTVGFLGAIVVLFSTFFTTARQTLDAFGQYFLSDWIGALFPQALATSWGYGDLDGSSYTDLEVAPLVFGPIALNLLITAALATWFTRWYGRRAEPSAQPESLRRRWLPRFRWPSLAARLGVRWPGRFAALMWLNARQSVPLCLAGLTIAVLITAAGMVESPKEWTLVNDNHEATIGSELIGQLPSATWFIGALWGAIVGVGIFSSELKPNLEHFWRSRPISPGAWFWMKFGVGLIAVVGMFDLIPAVLMSLFGTHLNQTTPTSLSAYLSCMPLIHAQIYAMAVAAVCRIKRPIPAAIFALVAFFVVDSVPKSIPGFEILSAIDVFNELNFGDEFGQPFDLIRAGYPIVYGAVLAITLGAIWLARRTVNPPRVTRTVVATFILFVVSLACGPAVTQAAETPTAADILAGIRQRESLQKNVRMRVSIKTTRTAAFLVQSASSNRRRRASQSNNQSVTEEAIYALSEQLPRRVWSEIGHDGTIRSTTTFDGSLMSQFNRKSLRLNLRGAASSAPEPTFLRPGDLLMSFDGRSLKDLLSAEADRELDGRSPPDRRFSVSVRKVEGEQLFDFTLTQAVPEPNASALVQAAGSGQANVQLGSRELRSHVTVNASRHYWPVKITSETTLIPGGQVITRTETTATGWIDAGPFAYPRQVKQDFSVDLASRNAGSQGTPPNPDNTSKANIASKADDQPTLSLVTTIESETLEIAVNTDLPDSTFTITFPPGAVIQDNRDRKHYEITDDGTEQLYVPKPKGLRGAVFTYHLFWITISIVVLFRRSASRE